MAIILWLCAREVLNAASPVDKELHP